MNTSHKIQAGDVVKLKSGGPEMTVQYIGEDTSGRTTAYCTWFGKDFTVTSERFVIDVLNYIHS